MLFLLARNACIPRPGKLQSYKEVVYRQFYIQMRKGYCCIGVSLSPIVIKNLFEAIIKREMAE